jgi:hypothetical protein
LEGSGRIAVVGGLKSREEEKIGCTVGRGKMQGKGLVAVTVGVEEGVKKQEEGKWVW